jgi:rubrerythrin
MTTVSCSSADDVVRFAIEKEEKAMDYYQKCSERAGNPGIREFFREMAVEEQRHRDMLRDLNPSKLDEIKLERVEDLHISEYLIDVSFKENITYQEALMLAMKKEEKASAFYASWKDKCMHEKTAKLFEMLALEEMKHKRRIETMYDDEILTWD